MSLTVWLISLSIMFSSYTMEFYAAERKKELIPFATAWMELVPHFTCPVLNLLIGKIRRLDESWLVWLSGLSASLQTKGSQVQFPVRSHA